MKSAPLAGLASLAMAGSALADPPGAQLYVDNCGSCHLAEGQGVAGAFPALAGDALLQGPAAPAGSVVLRGRGAMPGYAGDLSDEQIAQILTYIRSSWGNKAGPVTPAVVAAERAKFKAETPAH